MSDIDNIDETDDLTNAQIDGIPADFDLIALNTVESETPIFSEASGYPVFLDVGLNDKGYVFQHDVEIRGFNNRIPA